MSVQMKPVPTRPHTANGAGQAFDLITNQNKQL